MSENLLSIKNLNITRDKKILFKNFNLEINQNQIIGIYAPSGSGKSTLLNFIMGNLREDDKTEFSGNLIKMKDFPISCCFQESRLLESFSVEKNIMLPLENQLGKKSAKEKAEAMLKLVDLEYKKSKKARELSGGEKQRVSLCRALAFRARLLLLDEPFQSQDAQMKNRLMEMTKSCVEENNSAVILVSHQLEEIKFFTDNIIRESEFISNN